MSTNLTQAQVTQFDNMVKSQYQARGFLLNNTTQMRRNVVGSQARFTVIGKGQAQRKPSQDDVPLMNPEYTNVFAYLKEYVAAELTDIFDQQEVNFDELTLLSRVVAMAIGRRSDQIIIDALGAASGAHNIVDGAANFTYDKFLTIDEMLNKSGVSKRAGERYIALSAEGAKSLLKTDQFTNNQFISNKVLDGNGLDGQRVMGYNFIIIPDMDEGGLPKTADIRTCFAWHEFSAGMAIGTDFSTKIDWVARKLSWQTVGIFKADAVAIDSLGIVKVNIDETK